MEEKSVRAKLTSQAYLGEMNAVWHHHEIADTLRLGLLGAQVARALLVLGCATERGYSAARLKIEARASSHEIVCRRSVAQT